MGKDKIKNYTEAGRILADYPEDVLDKMRGHNQVSVLNRLAEGGDVNDVNYVRNKIDSVLAVGEVIKLLSDYDVDIEAVIAKIKELPDEIDLPSQPEYQEAVKKCFIGFLNIFGSGERGKEAMKMARRVMAELGKGINFDDAIEQAIVNAVENREIGYSEKIKSEFTMENIPALLSGGSKDDLPVKLDLENNAELKELLFSYFEQGHLFLVSEFERALSLRFDYSEIPNYEEVVRKAFIESLSSGNVFNALSYSKLILENIDFASIEGYQKAVMDGFGAILRERYSLRLVDNVAEFRKNFGKGTDLEYEEGVISAIKKVYVSTSFDDTKRQIREAFGDKINFSALDNAA